MKEILNHSAILAGGDLSYIHGGERPNESARIDLLGRSLFRYLSAAADPCAQTARQEFAGHLISDYLVSFRLVAPVFLASVAWLASGCALMTTAEKPEAASLPAPPLPASSVVLEVAFARIPLADEGAYNAIWSEVDEQHFSTDLRRQLAANGLRCGLVGMQLPPKLKEALDDSQPGAVERGEDSGADPQLDRAPRRIQCRGGQRAKVLVTKPLDTFSLLLLEDNHVRGLLLSQAQCLFGLKAYPQGDGRAKIELTPEVEHGEMKTQFVGRDGSVLPQMGQDRVVLDKLRLAATIAPGHVLMVSGTPEVKGVGSSFFTETDSGTTYRRILLVRLAVTQYDDLFAPDQIVQPLTTPGE